MNRWFAAACILAPVAAAPVHSAQLGVQSIVVAEPRSERPRGFNFRLIEDPVFAPGPTHNSGMVAQTPVAPNAMLGVGLLKVAPRKPGSGEFRQETGPTGSRKAAVRFVVKF